MSQTRRILPDGHKHHRSLAYFDVEGDRIRVHFGCGPRWGIAGRARTKGGGGWGMGPLGRVVAGRFSRPRRPGVGNELPDQDSRRMEVSR